MTLPAADGTNGQVLTTNGAGTLSFTTAGGGDIISEGNTSAEVIDTGSDGRFVVTTEGTERLRVDPSGRLLVGTSTSFDQASSLQVANTTGSPASLYLYGADNSQVFIGCARGTVSSPSTLNSADAIGSLHFRGHDNAGFKIGATIKAEIDSITPSNDLPTRLVFSTTADGGSSPTERMRIDNKGVTSTTCVSDNSGAFNIVHNGTNGQQYGLLIQTGNDQNNGTNYFLRCLGSGTDRLYIRSNGNVENTNNSYGGISDIKLKENIVNSGSQWNDLKALQVRKYNFKEGQTHTQIGLVAQEVELVSPGLVSESPDRDEEGNDLGTVTKSVNYSVLYMKAVKALQEAMERIEQLESAVATLQGS